MGATVFKALFVCLVAFIIWAIYLKMQQEKTKQRDRSKDEQKNDEK